MVQFANSVDNEEAPGGFTEKDAALGITSAQLRAFAGKARLGTDQPTPHGLRRAITDLIDDTVANGGKIRFSLASFDAAQALDRSSRYYDTYTSGEFRYVMQHYRNHVVFYADGKVVPAPPAPKNCCFDLKMFAAYLAELKVE